MATVEASRFTSRRGSFALFRRQAVWVVVLALAMALLPTLPRALAHTASPNPFFESVGSNNGVSFENPSFVVSGGNLSFDVNWSPCDTRVWDEATAVRLRGLDSTGQPNTDWSPHLTSFNFDKDDCPLRPKHRDNIPIFGNGIVDAPYHELEFRGAQTGTVFSRARSTSINITDPADGPNCVGKSVSHGTTTSDCRAMGANGRIGYGNPNFSVSNGNVDFDVTWTPCDVPWPEGVSVWMRGVNASGVPVTDWRGGGSTITFFNYTSSGCGVDPQPRHKHSIPIGSSDIASAAGHELEFRGSSTGEVFLRAKDWGVGVSPEQAMGTDCLDDRAPHAVNPTACQGDPVNSATGAFTTAVTDATLGGIGLEFNMTRSYTSLDQTPGAMGKGWTHSYEAALTILTNGDVLFTAEDGQRIYFQKKVDGTYKPFAGGRSMLSTVTGGYEVVRSDQLRYGFDTAGKLISIHDRDDVGVTLSYSNGELSTATDNAGRVVSFTNNGSGRITGIALPGSRSVSYGYSNGRLTSVTDVRGGTTTYSYDENDRLTEIIDQNNHTVAVNIYARNGRVTRQQDARGNWTDYAWDPETETATMTDARNHEWTDIYSYNVLTESIDPLGNSTKFSYDSDLNLTEIEDPLGTITTMTYDSRGNMLSRTAPAPLSYSESWTYDADNNVTSHTNRRSKTTSFDYDGNGNLIEVTQPGSVVTTITRDPSTGLVTEIEDPRVKTTTFGYDSARNLTSVTKPSNDKTTFGYDAAGRRTSMVEPRGNVTGADPTQFTWTFGYDAANHLTSVTDPLGNKQESSYDPAGNLDWAKDAKLRTTDYSYYADNRLHKVIAPDLTETVYEYDSVGNLTERTDAKLHATTYEYDHDNRLNKVVLPNGQTWTYTYDGVGNLETVVDAEGNHTTSDPTDGKTTIAYDEVRRVESVNYSDATPDVAFTYDENSNLKTVTDGAGTETWIYDDLDRVTSITRGADVFSYDYNATSQVTKRTYPDGTVVDYTYTDDGLIDTVKRGSAITDYNYLPGGLLQQTTLPANNGFIENRSYDRAGRLTQIENANGPVVLSRFAYDLDAVGNPETITDELGTVTSYGYDPETDFLTEVCFQAACPGANDPFIRYEYDAVGNRTKEIRPAQTLTYSYDDSDRLLSATGGPLPVSYSHDRNGNMTAAGSTTYAYDLAGKMKSLTQGSTTTTYSYDGLGKRLQASTGAGAAATTKFLWDPMWDLPELALERTGSGGALRRYVHGHHPISVTAGSSTTYYHRDMLGSVTDVTNGVGLPQWSYDYEPFGSSRSALKINPLAADNPMRFTGEYLDPTGLYHLRARQYDPGLGRFGASDPWPARASLPYVSGYVYVDNRPPSFADPSGLVKRPGESSDYVRPAPPELAPLAVEGKLYDTFSSNPPDGKAAASSCRDWGTFMASQINVNYGAHKVATGVVFFAGGGAAIKVPFFGKLVGPAAMRYAIYQIGSGVPRAARGIGQASTGPLQEGAASDCGFGAQAGRAWRGVTPEWSGNVWEWLAGLP